MKRQVKLVMAFLLAGTMLFTGCSGSGGEANDADTPAGTPADTSSDSGGEQKISILTSMAYGTKELDKVIQNFEAANPGVKVEIQHSPNNYEQNLASRINTGDIPDIFAAQTGTAVSAFYEYAHDFTDDPVVGKFKESAIDISKNSEGKLLSLPWTYESMGFIVNNRIFAEAGITEMPKTIAELEDVCIKIKAAGYTPFASALKETWVISHIGSHFIAGESKNPNEIIQRINDGELTFKDMKYFENMFDVIDLMIEYGPDKPLEVDWELSENRLVNDEVGMIHMGDWCEATLLDFNPDTDVSFMAVPVSDDGGDPTFLSSISWQFVLNKDSANLDKSKELLEYMLTSDDGIAWMTEGVKAVPSAKTDKIPDGMLATAAQGYIDSEKSLPWNHALWPAGYNPKFGSAIQSYILGEMGRDEVMEHLFDTWQMDK